MSYYSDYIEQLKIQRMYNDVTKSYYNNGYCDKTELFTDSLVSAPPDSTRPTIKQRMKKLTYTLKRVLNSNMQAMYKAGNLNGDLELTEQGRRTLNTILLEKFEKELGDASKEQLSSLVSLSDSSFTHNL